MDLLGYIAFAVLWFIAIGWAFGVRTRSVMPATILGSATFSATATAFTIIDVNKANLFWIIPSLYLLSMIYNILLSIPLIGRVLFLISNLYASIIRIGRSAPDKEL